MVLFSIQTVSLVIMWKPLVVLTIVVSSALISEGTISQRRCKCKKPNEIYHYCPNPCPPRECGINKALIYCAPAPKPGSKDCKPSCICADGFLRNKAGDCIPEKDCAQEQCKGPNERYIECLNPCPLQRCDVDPRLIRCAAPPQPGDPKCVAGCECFDGYARNDGICIPRDQCPQNCNRTHEIYSKCPAFDCRPHNCTEVGFPQPCLEPGPDPSNCPVKPGCICENGYVRNSDGDCIPIKECPSCGGDPNAVSGCGVNCGRRCSDRNNTEPVVCTQICKENGCDCREGYLFDDNTEMCVLPCDCTPTCGKDEVYSPCTQGDCGPKTCSQLGVSIPCPRIDPAYCIKGCLCKEGYVRDENGTCIPKDQCPQEQCKGPNERYIECLNPCPLQRCDVDPRLIRCAAPPQPGDPKCVAGCECFDGYARNDGICIPRDQCPQNCNRTHEIYSKCPAFGCRPHNCTEVGFPQPCLEPGPDPSNCPVKPGCICENGYVRNSDGDCIPIKECPSCGGDPNAVSGCGVNCGRRCSDRNNTEPVVCTQICKENGCDCREGYLFDDNTGMCVLPCDCTPTCGKDEVYSPCTQGDCGPKTCSQLGVSIPCPRIDPAYCIKGCLCKEGYVRDENGTCIPKDQCPQEQCKGPNERYIECLNPCPLQRCDVDPRLIRCAAPPQPGDPKCVAGCECFDGYARNDGICIPRDQCPQNCNRTHEIYSKCPAFDCRPHNCTEVGFPQPCLEPGPDPSNCPVKPGCICENGYVRNSDGDCIPIKECPSCGGDPNAVSGCGVNCGRRCSDRNNTEPVVCPKICKENGCDCREGYLFDDNTEMCVLLCDCTPTCGKDEVYSPCTQGDCGPKTCSQLGVSIPCPRIDPAYCIKGCLCKEGYVRDENGTCIPKDQCPSCGGDPNAVSGCGVNCGRYCSNYNSTEPVSCIELCNLNGCDCKEGFVVDDNTGKCIPPSECSLCGKNEVLSNCSNGGCGPWRCVDLGIPTGCVKMDQKYCILGCVCQEGYVRDENDVCIPVTECTECGGDPNARAGCGINCGRLCSNYKNAENISCIAVCYENACDCKTGFVLDENTNKCVEPENCTPTCTENEVFSGCVNGGCEARYCSQLGQPVPCVRPAQCKPGCLCAEGYLRDAQGKCVPIDQCPHNCTGANEIYDPCPPNCPPQTCESIGQKYFCPFQSTHSTCYGACRCKPNYFRNKIGECISEKDCLKCNRSNEYYSCGGACDNVCATLSKQNQTNCPIINIKCNEMCYCEEGYARDKDNNCIPIENCPGICGENERWDKCPARLCSPQSCKDLGFNNKPCEFDENSPCPGPPGCVCDFNFVRDNYGKCIPKMDCPSCGGDPNAKSGCGLNCGRLCSNYDKGPVPCPRICLPNACDCKTDYVFDENTRKCVLPKQCTPTCKENEVFSNCTNGGCQARNCSQLGKPVPCVKLDPKSCIKGCVCAEGYLRAKNGTCVPVGKCDTMVCKKHEVFSDCTNGGCEARNCSQLGQPIPCVKLDPKSCIKGCVCAEGYLRARNGTCVPVDKCDNCNKPHEYYDSCSPSCPPQTCESIGKKFNCPITAAVCRGACRCEKGYYRNKKGECIREKDCLQCRGRHEYFSCGSACDNECKTLHRRNQTNCPIKNIKCVNRCYCEEGYARDENNICVPINKCPSPKCGENEKLEKCPPALCKPQNCSQLGFPVACPGLPKYGCPEPPGCICIDGYVRDSRGKCIPSNKCPSCGGDPHAVSGCGVNCHKTCSTYNRPDIVCPPVCYSNACDCRKGYVLDENLGKCVRPEKCTPICRKNEVYDSCANGGCGKWNCSQLGQPDLCIDPLVCIGGCNCKEGYLRAKDGTCVPIKQCPAPECGKNERFEFCPDSVCEPQKCSELGFPVPCAASTGNTKCSAEPACICNNGFVRNDKGICIPKDKCPSCGGDPNAQSGCGINCGRLCSNYNKGPVPCPRICRLNACDCKKDYVLDLNTGKCVLPKQCTPTCGEDEMFSECINGGCDARNCSQLGQPVPCVKLDPKYCIKGCICQPGYLRNSSGICVPENQCEQYCPGQNEVYESCPSSCPPQTCESIDKVYHCPLMKIDQDDCKPACRCKEGYFRNKIGQCISKDDCLKCTGKNEFFSCGGACDNVCATLSEQNQTNCPIINIQCNRMCYCEEGYARNDKHICIPINQCPPPKCEKNERLENCPDWLCTPQSCSQVGYPIACPAFQGESTDNQTCPGRPGCVCIDGYVKNDSGKCIPVDQCPSCGGDPNAVQGCGVNCGRLCSNYKNNVTFCPLICKINGCDCRKDYVYDSNLNKCVLPKDCTPTCGINEVYDICANGGCQKRNCSQVGEPTVCIDPITCFGGCVCQEGFLRNESGICVPENQCPIQCTKPHEVYNCCPRTCPPQTCNAIGITYPCPNPPEGKEFCCPACVCEDGYYRNSVGECISEANCLKCNKPNEHFSCGPECDNECARLSTWNQTNCPIKNKRCVEKCYCDEGYARDENNICIPIDQCNATCPRPHEVYNSCPSTCPPQTCESLQRTYGCPNEQERPCEPGCVCEDGYFRNKIGECITKDQCLQCKEQYEYFSCGGACDNVCLTLNEQSKDDCPIINIQCNKMCYCEDGYARNGSNICIPIKDCPPPRCSDDERWEENPCQVCDPLTCSEVGKTKECPPVQNDGCDNTPTCVCKSGLVRKDNGDCIPSSDCNT